MTWLAVALSFWLGSAQETCTDCDVPEESALLQKTKEKDQGMPLWWYIYQANKKKKYDYGSEVTWRCAPDVNAAQYAWKNLILSISSTYAEEGDFVQVAKDGIAALYGYDIGPVLFKPTQAVEEPFRGTAEGALSYFVGAENLPPGVGIPEDKGFAIAGGDTWSKVRFDNDQIYCVTDYLAFAEGYYYFTNAETNVTTGVEYSFGYQWIEGNKLKIILHHSSIPYSPPPSPPEYKQTKTRSQVEFDNDQIYCLGDIAIAEGYYYFTNAKTKAVAAVEYSFGYEKIDHEWKIFLHHSSIPYSPPPSLMQENAKKVTISKHLS
eukprot:Skav205125  [mRNA]  locus=scaffold3585:812:3725:- [translate_table: standard]